MALFKYLPPERANTFKNRQIRFSPGTEFNDPFDGVPVLLNFNAPAQTARRYEDVMQRRYLEYVAKNPGDILTLGDFKKRTPIKEFEKILASRYQKYRDQFYEGYKKLRETIGVFCLCRNGESAAMWAHYAKNHSGFLIEFDEAHPFFQRFKNPDEGQWTEVSYSAKRPVWDYEREDGHDAFEFKSEEWSYEKEVRILRLLDRPPRGEVDVSGKPTLFRVPPDAIISITIGMHSSSETRQTLLDALSATQFRHVQRCHGETDFEEYRVLRCPGWLT